ncbi:MAG: VWA domain-containing protein [Calditrichaeota bacterium]|nr:MAG: VWA domain-containing protein [Calditrichota bacterium]MBL1203811.1 VWA domain-containing protein [Calditrichota bacterium]NOG43641.1 VWA domain-containing protein [Calditrichota bacterium]
MEVLRFANPSYLYGLWAVFLITAFYIYVFRSREKLLKKFGHIEILQKMMPGYKNSRRIWKAALIHLAFISLVLAISGPQIGTAMEDVKREGIDIIVALDVSLSMQAEDIAPNRLEKAKYEVNKLIDILEGDRIGLVAFAGMAHVQAPLTLDYSAARLFLRLMETNLIPQPGTAIGDAIRTAQKAFNQKERKHKVLILITDGEDHESDPLKAAEEAAQEGIIIYTIGLGSPQGVPIPLINKYGNKEGFKKDRKGNVVTTKLDATTLQQIAYATEGKYYISTSGEAELDEIYKEVSQMEKKELTSRQFSQYENRFQIFVALAILFLLIETFLPVTVKIERP